MERVLAGLIFVLCAAMQLFCTAPSPINETWQTYIDHTYQVKLRFPGEWKRDSLYYDRPYFGVERRLHTVARGFFQFDVAGDESDTPEQACQGLAEHVLKPFGANPSIRQMKVDGQSACLVWPSNDQGAPWDAEVVVKYPQPLEINGDRYSLLELNADKDYIFEIVQSLQFISSSPDNAPFLLAISPQNAKGPAVAIWKADAPLLVNVTMKNTSRQVFHVTLTDPATDYRMAIFHKGDVIRVTKNLPEAKEEQKSGARSRRHLLKTLYPQEACQETIEIRFFAEREAPGEYTLQVERDLPPELGKGIVVSNTVKLVVVN